MHIGSVFPEIKIAFSEQYQKLMINRALHQKQLPRQGGDLHYQGEKLMHLNNSTNSAPTSTLSRIPTSIVVHGRLQKSEKLKNPKKHR